VWSRDLLSRVDNIPEHEAVRLLTAATGRTRSDVLVGFEVTADERTSFDSLVERRLADEPLQYIEGTVAFGPVELLVDSRVLIPRPETEYLFEQVVEMADDPDVIVDLCTGSGNLALALAATFPDADVYAVDLSPDAVVVARANADRNDLAVEFFIGDLFDPLPEAIKGSVDVLISNPPYLAEDELANVPSDVLQEPEMALVSGPDGDELLAAIAAEASEWLSPDGILACEISEFHGDRITHLFERYGPSIGRDLAGRERYVFGSLRFK
jgi:release factor glutamine methyltransferase